MSPTADNYVQIRIKADDTAKPDLTELKLQLDELGHKVDTAKVDVDDDDASLKLLRLNAKLADLNRKVANPKIKVAGAARAEADILAVSLELDKLKAKEDAAVASAGPDGLLHRIFNGLKGGGSKIGGIGSSISGAGGGTLFTNPYSLAAIGAGITALLPELTGLVSGFAAAGAGAGAFYLLAHPAISNLETDYTNLSAAQTAYQKAQNTYAIDPTKTNAAAVKTAADALKAARMSMSQDAGGAAEGLVKLRTEYGKLTTAFQPDVFRVFNAGLKLANTLLPDIVPFARTFADVLTSLLGQAGKFASSKGFTDWLKQFHGLEGPALAAIGKGVGEVAVQFGKLLTTMSAKDVVNAINIAFSVLSGTIDGLRHVVEAIMRAWDVTSATMARDARQVGTAFDALRTDIANWARDLASYFSEAAANVARWAADVQRDADNVVKWFQALPGKILAALASLPGLLFKAGQHAVQSLIDGLGSMMGSLGSMGGHLAGKIAGFFGLSPAKEGPLSGGGAPEIRGQHFAADLARGMASGLGGVASAARQIAGAAGAAPGGGYGAAAAGASGTGTLHLQLDFSGGSDQEIMVALARAIRVRGGSANLFNRKVQFQ